jgi:hypothetical protein
MAEDTPSKESESEGQEPQQEDLPPMTAEQFLEYKKLRLEENKQERVRLKDQQDYEARAYRDTYRVERAEGYTRLGLALLLVIGTLGLILFGIGTGIEPERLSQYLSPISGLAGIAVGYFFGRGSMGPQSSA